MENSVSVVVVNYQTPDLLEKAVTSFAALYPDIPICIVDNGSKGDSPERCEALRSHFPETVRLIRNESNVFHGPAMDQAIHAVSSPFVFILDSDTVSHTGGFLEEMIDMIESDSNCYTVGQEVTVSRRGFARAGGLSVPVSAFLLLRREMYLQLPPFEHHGLPVLKNCTAAAARGWRICSYPIERYIDHIGRGTAKKYGYGLGFRSRLDYLLNRLGL
jgi:glycosyltransferase involved in cell wall biosynthesis